MVSIIYVGELSIICLKKVILEFKDLSGRHLVPIHWGMFSLPLSLDNCYDTIVESSSRAEKLGISIMTPRLGQFIGLNRQNIFEKCWENFDRKEINIISEVDYSFFLVLLTKGWPYSRLLPQTLKRDLVNFNIYK